MNIERCEAFVTAICQYFYRGPHLVGGFMVLFLLSSVFGRDTLGTSFLIAAVSLITSRYLDWE